MTISATTLPVWLTLTDNGDGTYTASYTPTNIGEDKITGTINGNAITHDTDGTSDGIFNEKITGASATHLEITGNNTQQAGTPQTITITAKNDADYIDYAYTGDKQITLSGPLSAPDGTVPTCRDKDGFDIELTNPTTLTFNSGQATCELILYNKEQIQIDATDGTIDTNGDDNYDLDIDISPAQGCSGDLDVNPTILKAFEQVDIELDNLEDEYGNQITTGDSVEMEITGVNTQTLTVEDSSTTYTSNYTPTNLGIDTLNTTINTCTLSSVDITIQEADIPVCGDAGDQQAAV